MASIEKRKTSKGETVYRVKIRYKGQAKSQTFPRLAEAKRWAEETQAAIRDSKYLKSAEAKRRTLGETITRYIEQILPTKPKSAGSQRHQLIWWRNKLGHKLLSDVEPNDIAEMRDELSKGNEVLRQPATVHHYLMALSHVFTVAIKEWGVLEHSPIPRVTKPKLPQGRVRYLSEEERARLLKACRESDNPYLYAVVVIAISTGARKMEILKLRWQDVDLIRGVITLHETKNGQRRALPLVGHALELMHKLAASRQSDNDLIFPGRNPKKPLVIRHPWEAALKQANVDNFHFHDCRHSAASYLAMGGASLVDIAHILGHSTLNMVKRYAHLSQEHTTKVISAMNKRIFQEINSKII